MMQRNYDNENKIVDLSSLPPCQSVLYLHTSRANFVAIVWKSADDHQLEFPNLSDHGWTDMCEIIWMTRHEQDMDYLCIFDKLITTTYC